MQQKCAVMAGLRIMDLSGSRLEKKIRSTLCDHLKNGSKVVAIKFYHEITMTPLLESKQFVDAFELDSNATIGDERYREFLQYLEARDFGGAAARLVDDLNPMLAGDAIERTFRIANLLNLDVTAFELPSSIACSLWELPYAQSIVTDRALEQIRERMIRRFLQKGIERSEAEKIVDEATDSLSGEKLRSRQSIDASLQGIDPRLVAVLRNLLGPIPEKANTPPGKSQSRTESSLSDDSAVQDALNCRREIWFRRIGRLAALLYAVVAIFGMSLVLDSHFGLQQPKAFSMSKGLLVEEQAANIEQWLSENQPVHANWFVSNVRGYFSPVKLEPNLPLMYADEEWTWERKLAAIDASAIDLTARIQRCHEELVVLYLIAFVSALIHWVQRDVATGLFMVLLGAMGIPMFISQIVRWEFDNPYWLGPLIIPGSVALVASVLHLVFVRPKTNKEKEVRAFWFAVAVLITSAFVLGWTIVDGNQLKSGAGVGVFGSTWLMLYHGWRLIRVKRNG